MISIKKKFLFIHVPKTGGNSIQNLLKSYSEDDIIIKDVHHDGIERFGVSNKKYNTSKHSTLTQYKSTIDSTTYKSLYKFAVIRNPWDRMVSNYFSPHRGIKEWDRNNFLDLINKTPPLRHYICEETLLNKLSTKLGVPLPNYDEKLDKDIDFILKFENLHDDFKAICKELEITHKSLPIRNASDRTHYSKYYDDDLAEVVKNKFPDEIKYGNYIFEKNK